MERVGVLQGIPKEAPSLLGGSKGERDDKPSTTHDEHGDQRLLGELLRFSGPILGVQRGKIPRLPRWNRRKLREAALRPRSEEGLSRRLTSHGMSPIGANRQFHARKRLRR